jgi:hypothetical protein
VALKIRELAAKHSIPIVENPPLARALHATVEIEEIPTEHYKAVVEIIGYVMKLRRGAGGRGPDGVGNGRCGNSGGRMSETLAHKASAGGPRDPLRRALHPIWETGYGHAGFERNIRATSVDRSRAGRGGSIGTCAGAMRSSARRSASCWSVVATPGLYLALLAFLAMAGVFSLFALATGILRVAGKDTGASPMLKMVVDDAVDGLLVPTRTAASSTPTPLSRPRRSHDPNDVGRSSGCSSGSRRVGGGLSPAQGGARRPRAQEEVRVTGLKKVGVGSGSASARSAMRKAAAS